MVFFDKEMRQKFSHKCGTNVFHFLLSMFELRIYHPLQNLVRMQNPYQQCTKFVAQLQ